MVAARRLRKSIYKQIPNLNIDDMVKIPENKKRHIKNEYLSQINSLNNTSSIGSVSGNGILNSSYLLNYDNNFDETKNDSSGSYSKFKVKLMIKITLSIIIIFLSLLVKNFFLDKVLDNKYVLTITNEYNKDYTKNGCLEKIEDICLITSEKFKYIIPESLKEKIENKYLKSIKPRIVDFELKEFLNNIFTKSNEINSSNINYNITDDEIAKAGETIQTSATVLDVPEIEENVRQILAKNIDIKKPVEGTITSKYGVREIIFNEIGENHTGIDIANKLGTEIKSATNGVVTKVEKNNKYYGNNVEIETDGVIFKYAHLKEIKVNEGDNVTQDSIIGLMGSTGMSTGSHLHFEIRINSKTVDPNDIIKFY